MFSYKTITVRGEGQYREKGSRFLGFALPVENEGGIRQQLEAFRKSYFDARHHCYAWVLGPEKRYRAFDDGEPNHSAGDPILGQIRSRDLTNVLVVVVRYFGGTKLGVGGLVAAYKTAASLALDEAGIIKREVMGAITLRYPYHDTPQVMKLVKDFGLSVIDQTFEEQCLLTASFRARDEKSLMEKIVLLKNTGTAIEVIPS